MNQTTALQHAHTLWGNRAMVRKGPFTSSPQIRAAAKQAQADLIARRATGERGLVPGINRQNAISLRYQYAVGVDYGYAFHVYGQGDSWDEAFASAINTASNSSVGRIRRARRAAR